MPITALQGYDGRAFETATVNTANTILTLTRGNGSVQLINLPTGTATAPATLQVGPSPHYLNENGGALWLNFGGIRQVSFYMRYNSGGVNNPFLADGRTTTGSGYCYSSGAGGNMHVTIDGVAVNETNTSGAFAPFTAGTWRLVTIDNVCAADGLKLLCDSVGMSLWPNIDLADMRVYSRTFTAAEKANITAANIPVDSLLARYDFTNVISTGVVDQSGGTPAHNATFIASNGVAV